MVLDKYTIKRIKDDYPYNLLLLADETKEAIAKYLFNSEVFIVENQEEQIAVFCLYPINKDTIELKNIAVKETYRNRGLGAQLLTYIKEYCRGNYKALIVGTPDTSEQTLRFYRRNGFKNDYIRENFFIENYPQPIIENGIQLKHMQVLKLEL